MSDDNFFKKHGKHDLEKWGLFKEMPYLHKDKEKPKKAIYNPVIKGGFMTSPMKVKCGNQDGYFEQSFKRLHIGDKPKVVKRKEGKDKGKRPFVPTGPMKKHSTPDDYYGCFTDPVEHFSGKTKEVKKEIKKLLPNPMTNPPKKGGPGFLDITINPYPEHETDRPTPKPIVPVRKRKKKKTIPFYGPNPTDYFDENPFYEGDNVKHQIYISPAEREKMNKNKKEQKKKNKKVYKAVFIPNCLHYRDDGYFTEFPKYKTDREKKKRNQEPPKPAIYKPPYLPPSNLAEKTMQYKSVLQSTDFRIHLQNHKTYEPQYVKYL